MSNDILQTKCIVCREIVHEPYIECCECDANLCTGCFTTGQETKNHKNNHKYAIRRNDFPLFEYCNWTAKEECKLLSAILTYGYGNWEEISKIVHTRSKLECKEHYKKYYIDNVQYKELDIIPHSDQSMFPKPVVPYLYSTEISNNPPRNNRGEHLAGYNAQRSEFELSYDNNAENIFRIEGNYSDDEDEDCMDALKISVVNVFNTRLRERKRRYKVIQEHGLIMKNKLISWVHRYDSSLSRQIVEKLLVLMQFMTGMQFDAFIESLSLETELFQKLMRLHEYRSKGIKTLCAANIYRQLKQDHIIMLKEQKQATAMMLKKYDSQSPIKNGLLFMKEARKAKKSLPLDIVDLPGYHLLLESEKTLCSNLRLIPLNYIDIKSQLVAENSKLGLLRLIDARKIIKIDVNKTRKIYDHLAAEGFISKPIK